MARQGQGASGSRMGGRVLAALIVSAGLAACGSGDEPEPGAEGAGASGATSGGEGGEDAVAAVGATSGNGSSTSTSTSTTTSTSTSTSGSGGGTPAGLADVGTLVVLGDSIGDGGGQGPFYYALLRAQLEAHYGHELGYHNNADSGSKTSALSGQVDDLPGSLAGPVAVAITSGGNDMKDQLFAILSGSDGPAREQMGDNISAALEALLEPDRFGAGVAVHVFEATIYDASDGQGNFGSNDCNISIDSPQPVDPFFAAWNGEIADRVMAADQVVSDMHGHFYGHGFNNPPSWYAGDCTHPNTTGHAELAGLFASLITGS